MLETNVCIELLRGRTPSIAARMRRHEIDTISISSITLAELAFGGAKSSRPTHHESLLIAFCAPLGILPFDDRAAECYGRVRAGLERMGAPIGPLDTLIAAHALSLGVTLVTSNTKEFRRVNGLRVEDWAGS